MIQGAETSGRIQSYLKAYSQGTEAWFPDSKDCWILGKLTEKNVDDNAVELTFSILGKKQTINFKCTVKELIASKGGNLPPLQNPPALNGIDNLAMLSHLHEPAVFHNLWLRYLNGYIYTYSGIVLIAMNPFSNMGIYGENTIRNYQNTSRDNMDPHVYAVAEEALRSLKKFGRNQSIIVSGESGAGKTQSARYLMEYFAYANKVSQTRRSSSANHGGIPISGIEEAVLSTNPIMESFGNSKTVRNDNSSRFGKYTEILFSDCPETGEPRICSARIRTYLLERSRVIFQPQNERNFHIFYQLCAGAPAAEREELGLKPWEHFHYLNQGNAGVVEEMNDELMFMETTKALSSAKISFTTQWNIFRVCAGILHIGNIKIKQVRDKVTIDDSDEALLTAVKLLGIDAKEFKKWILNKTIKMRSEKIVKPLDLSQAIVVRDSVAKYLYSSLFSWLVAEIGTNLEKNKSPSSTPKNFIGVLDIYGFEHFEENSFEQFCINYANEKLQQEFNSHVFKLEQEEYFNEKIKWSFITFTDNQECIDLIEGKNGVFDMLNEESRLTMGTDKSLLIKLNDRFLGKNNFYLSPRFGQDSFTVKHYACDVTYKINGFIEKNKDTVPDEQHQLLLSTAFGFLREVLSLKTQDVTAKSSSTDAMASENKTLGSIFKSSLVSLMDTICQTEVHYIRCIKPNYECHPFKFDPKMVLQQLRACGVLETIKISCKGYPTRATYDDFVDRYYMLVQSSLRNEDSKEFTIAIVNSVLDDADKFQMGLTKVFFRAGQLAYLEKLRNERQIEAAILIQRNALRHLHRKRFIRMMEAALKIQCAFRRHLAIKISSDLRHTRAATIIQKYYRRHLAVRRLAQFKKLIVSAQIIYRYIDSLDIRKTLQYCNACTIIQKSWRAALQRRKFAKVVSHVILVQSRLRTLIILMQVPQLLAEARSVGKLKETNHRLENKIIELSRKLEESKIQEEKYLQDISHCTITIEKWKVKYSKLESKYSDLENKMLSLKNDLESRIDGLSEDILIHKSNNTELERLLEEKNLIISKYESKFKGGYNGYPVRSNRSIYSLTGMMSSRSYGKMDKSVQRDRIGLGDDLSVTSAQQHDLHRSMSHAHAQGLTGYQMVDHNDDNSGILTHMHDDREYRSHIIEPHSRILGTSSPFDIDYRGYRDILDCLKDPHLPTEVRRCLITNLRVPHVDDPDKTRTGDWHILYCANIIGNIALQLLNHDCYSEYGSLMHAIIEALGLKSKEIESYDDYSFWVSNTFTLIRIIYTIFRGPAVRESLEDGIDKCLNIPEEFSSYTRELENLLITILNNWINKIKSDIRHMIISAVIESQPLPGYAMPEKKRSNLLHTFIRARKQPDSKIDDITSFLNDLLFSMKAYVVDDSIQYQIILEVYTYINCVALNDLLSRENFWTWMRGLQLSYNVSSLQEWCKKNDKFHGIQQTLINIYQASKLISMNKGIANVAETISDVCFSLSRTQVSRIVSIYVISAGESKASPEFLKMIADGKELADNKTIYINQNTRLSWYDGILGSKIVPYAPQRKPVPKWISMPIVTSIYNHTIT